MRLKKAVPGREGANRVGMDMARRKAGGKRFYEVLQMQLLIKCSLRREQSIFMWLLLLPDTELREFLWESLPSRLKLSPGKPPLQQQPPQAAPLQPQPPPQAACSPATSLRALNRNGSSLHTGPRVRLLSLSLLFQALPPGALSISPTALLH